MDFSFDAPKMTYSRDRVITNDPVRPASVKSTQVAPIEEFVELGKSAEKLKFKAQTLLKAIDVASEGTTVPVSPDATDVRAAVQRVLGGTDGSVIPYSLWVQLIQHPYTKAARVNLEDLSAALTGDVVTDSTVITKSVDGTNIAPYLAQMSAIFVANQLLGAFSGFDQAAKDATKQPPGTELGPLFLQLAVSYAAFQSVQGIENFIQAQEENKPFAEVTAAATKAAFEQFQAQAKVAANSAAAKVAKDELAKSQYDSDRDLILSYASNYITNTTREGYDTWIRYPFVRAVENDVTLSSDNVSRWINAKGVPLLATEVPMDIIRGFACEQESANDALNRAAAALRSRYGQDALCCLVRILSELGVKVGRDATLRYLATFKKFLRLFIMLKHSFGMKQLLTNVLNGWQNKLRDAYERDILIVVRRFVFHFVQPILDFLQREDLELLRVCTPFEELTSFLLQAAEKVCDLLKRLLHSFNQSLQNRHDANWELDLTSPELERAKALLNLLEAVEDAVNTGTICTVGGSVPSDVTKLYEDLVGGVKAKGPKIIQLPPKTGDPLLDFDDVKWDIEGTRVPFENGFSIGAGSPMKIAADCLKRIPKDIIPEAPELARL